ncbi:MAG TPA: hypothetical protein VLL08_22010 [Kineosporiaceae bacterium]|nr:hypothetical protein [Kineosporiaceae bacterium]
MALDSPAASAATSAPPAPVRGIPLPVPRAAAGQTVNVSVPDITPSGVVGGTIVVVTQAPDGSQTSTSTAQRWLPTAGGWRRQQLAQPSDTRNVTLSGLTNAGEAAGSLTDVDGQTRAVRWSADGRSSVTLGEPNSSATAVGPNGPWGVHTTEPGGIVTGDSELVYRDGRRTLLRGTPELDAGYDRTVLALAGPRTGIVGVRDGIGRGTTVRPVLYRDGATLALPVFFSFFVGPTCVSQVQPDGSVAYSGLQVIDGVPQAVLVRHVGGVPGQDIALEPAGTADTTSGWLGCQTNGVSDRLAADGGVAGVLQQPSSEGSTRQAAYWNADGVRTLVPLQAGEQASTGAAVATGARMVIQAETEAGPTLSLWRNGARTPLTLPTGWKPSQVIEYTETGLILGVATDAAGASRPVVWDVSEY